MGNMLIKKVFCGKCDDLMEVSRDKTLLASKNGGIYWQVECLQCWALNKIPADLVQGRLDEDNG